MKNCLTIFAHEIRKLITDKKMLASIFLLPLITVFLMVSISSLETTDSDTESYEIIALNNMFSENQVVEYSDDITVNITNTNYKSLDELTESRKLKESNAVIGTENNNVTIYYNSTDTTSIMLSDISESIIQSNYLSSFISTQPIPLEYSEIGIVDISEDKNSGNLLAALFLPYMLVLLLFTNISNYTCDTIAGEKERGVFGKILLTPISPSSIILGKTLASMVCGIISSVAYIVVLSISSVVLEKNSDINLLGFDNLNIEFTEFLLVIIYAIILSCLIANIAILCSLYSKTSKDARTMLMPFMILSIALSLYSMLRVGNVESIKYAIPFYNICIVVQDILCANQDISKMFIAVISLVIYSIITFMLTLRAFKKENIRY